MVVVNDGRIESDVMNDYNGLAELAGLDYLDMTIINRQKSPSMKLLNLLTTHHNGCAVGKLWMSLHMMGRFDMMAECKRQIGRFSV